jgi:hypothetical protein
VHQGSTEPGRCATCGKPGAYRSNGATYCEDCGRKDLHEKTEHDREMNENTDRLNRNQDRAVYNETHWFQKKYEKDGEEPRGTGGKHFWDRNKTAAFFVQSPTGSTVGGPFDSRDEAKGTLRHGEIVVEREPKEGSVHHSALLRVYQASAFEVRSWIGSPIVKVEQRGTDVIVQMPGTLVDHAMSALAERFGHVELDGNRVTASDDNPFSGDSSANPFVPDSEGASDAPPDSDPLGIADAGMMDEMPAVSTTPATTKPRGAMPGAEPTTGAEPMMANRRTR